MNMKLHIAHGCLLGALTLACGSIWADNGPKAPQPDVTMTVIPSGQDVVKTVVQNISVPANAGAHKPGPTPPPGGKPGNAKQFGQQTAQSAQQIEETQEAQQAAQHEADASRQIGESAAQAQQQAQEAAENQAQQAQQAQQQAQTLSHQQPIPPPPPPPLPGLLRS